MYQRNKVLQNNYIIIRYFIYIGIIVKKFLDFIDALNKLIIYGNNIKNNNKKI